MEILWTHMATRIIIPQSLRAPKALKQRIGCENHILNLLDTAIFSSRYRGDVLHYPLRSLRFTCTRFSRDDNALIFVVRVHIIISRLCDAIHVRIHLKPVLSLVALEDRIRVNTQI